MKAEDGAERECADAAELDDVADGGFAGAHCGAPLEMRNLKMAMELGSTGILACAASCQVRGVARCEETMAAFFCGVGVLAAILNLGLSGAGFSLSSRDHLVRIRTKAKIGWIAEWRRRTGRSAC